jgi:hypothetical protein
MNDSTTQAAVSAAERKLTEDEISELRQQAGELYEQAARQDRRVKRLRHLEEGRARLAALSAELVAAGRCGRLSERDRDSDDDYAFASVCVLAAGHDGDCDDSSALVPAPGTPPADEAEREAAGTRDRAAQLSEQASDAWKQLDAERKGRREGDQAAVAALTEPEVRGFLMRLAAESEYSKSPGGQERLARLAWDVVATARRRAADREAEAALDRLRTDLPQPGTAVIVGDAVWTVVRVFPGRGLDSVALHVRSEDGNEAYVATKTGEEWHRICAHLKRTGEPCRSYPNHGDYCGTHAGKADT